MASLKRGGANYLPSAGFASLGLDFLGLDFLAVESLVCILAKVFWDKWLPQKQEESTS